MMMRLRHLVVFWLVVLGMAFCSMAYALPDVLTFEVLDDQGNPYDAYHFEFRSHLSSEEQMNNPYRNKITLAQLPEGFYSLLIAPLKAGYAAPQPIVVEVKGTSILVDNHPYDGSVIKVPLEKGLAVAKVINQEDQPLVHPIPFRLYKLGEASPENLLLYSQEDGTLYLQPSLVGHFILGLSKLGSINTIDQQPQELTLGREDNQPKTLLRYEVIVQSELEVVGMVDGALTPINFGYLYAHHFDSSTSTRSQVIDGKVLIYGLPDGDYHISITPPLAQSALLDANYFMIEVRNGQIRGNQPKVITLSHIKADVVLSFVDEEGNPLNNLVISSTIENGGADRYPNTRQLNNQITIWDMTDGPLYQLYAVAKTEKGILDGLPIRIEKSKGVILVNDQKISDKNMTLVLKKAPIIGYLYDGPDLSTTISRNVYLRFSDAGQTRPFDTKAFFSIVGDQGEIAGSQLDAGRYHITFYLEHSEWYTPAQSEIEVLENGQVLDSPLIYYLSKDYILFPYVNSSLQNMTMIDYTVIQDNNYIYHRSIQANEEIRLPVLEDGIYRIEIRAYRDLFSNHYNHSFEIENGKIIRISENNRIFSQDSEATSAEEAQKEAERAQAQLEKDLEEERLAQEAQAIKDQANKAIGLKLLVGLVIVLAGFFLIWLLTLRKKAQSET